jgi:hypothetical protein
MRGAAVFPRVLKAGVVLGVLWAVVLRRTNTGEWGKRSSRSAKYIGVQADFAIT